MGLPAARADRVVAVVRINFQQQAQGFSLSDSARLNHSAPAEGLLNTAFLQENPAPWGDWRTHNWLWPAQNMGKFGLFLRRCFLTRSKSVLDDWYDIARTDYQEKFAEGKRQRFPVSFEVTRDMNHE
jgi:hypothetical protein